MPFPAPQVVYDEEPVNQNGFHDQEVPIEDHAYEEINNHVSGEDVVDLQNGLHNGHGDVEVEPIQQEVRFY